MPQHLNNRHLNRSWERAENKQKNGFSIREKTMKPINLIVAALSGSLLPSILNRLNIDPAIAGTVVLTTITDVVGFLSFLGLATVFYA